MSNAVEKGYDAAQRGHCRWPVRIGMQFDKGSSTALSVAADA